MRLYLKRALIALLLLAPVLYGAFALTSHPVEPHPYFASGDVLVIAHRGGKRVGTGKHAGGLCPLGRVGG